MAATSRGPQSSRPMRFAPAACSLGLLMIRVFWFNGGVWHEDLPSHAATLLARHLASFGYMVWQRPIAER